MTTAVGGTTTAPTQSAPANNASNEIMRNADDLGMGKDAFLKLLVAQVRFQDPSKPLDSNSFIAQTAQFSVVEQLGKLQEAQTEMLAFQRVLFSAGLVGKQISATNSLGREITGAVSSVRILNGAASVMIGQEEIPVDSITRIHPTPAPTGS
jgi:flagellar basal-body rod modification protein FlgD